jgi:hypothetical protein
MEIWKDIIGYEGSYQASSHGRIRGLNRTLPDGRKWKGKILSVSINENGYYLVVLVKNGKQKTWSVHRLIAKTFLPNPNNLPQINHIDANKLNNKINNLEWISIKDHQKHSSENGLKCHGEKHHDARLTKGQVLEIRQLYVPKSRKYGSVALSRKYNIGVSSILKIIKRKTWKHL